MKKIFALMLAVMMIATMSVTAFAAESPATVTTDNGTATITVNGTYNAGGTAETKISVVVSWDAMEFTYTGASEGNWDPATHSYTGSTAAGWSTDTATITVTNHSNVAITATLAWAQNTDLTGTITGTFTETSGTENDNILALATAVGTTFAEAPSATAEFGISGDAITANETLGTITVTIAKAD